MNALISPVLEIRVLLIGPHASGKTAIRRAALHQSFTEEFKPGFLSTHNTYIHINQTTVPVELWDATEDSWTAISQLLVDVVIVCIDISNPRAIDYLKNAEVRHYLLFPCCKLDNTDILLGSTV